jgi:hypothetical protein
VNCGCGRFNKSVAGIVGGVRYPPQNLVDRKWYFQFGQQFFIAEFLHDREVSLESKVVEVRERIRWAGK